MEQEWLLLDMHLHSEYSKINKPNESSRVKSMSAKDFVDTLSNKKVRIFSITDHNYFSKTYYDEIDEYIKTNDINMKLINGTELDVYVSLENNNEDFIHICVYFDDSLDRVQLENTINTLYKNTDGTPKKPKFNDILEKFQELKTKFIVIPHGNKERGIFKNQLIDKLSLNDVPEFYKYAMYKIFNAFDVNLKYFDKSNEFWASSFCERTKKFYSLIDGKNEEEIEVIKNNISKRIKNNEYRLSDEEQIIYNYILKYGSYFAYFVFSDWHNKEAYNPRINNFIFGSLEYAFSSFEMATLDPVSRIIKSEDYEIAIPPTILKNIKFKINGIDKEISFSPGLNAIVGKRGSGKSLLLSVIKNLVRSDDPQGALNFYKTLNISDISAKNRGGIELSLGSLDSVAFLTQSQITEIFENPNKAQQAIANNFLEIKSIELGDINEIIDLGLKIKPYNINYKNVTSNILSIKKSNEYSYSSIGMINEIDIKSNFIKIIKELDDLIANVNEVKLNSHLLIMEKKRLEMLQELYLHLISSYNSILENNTERITEMNSKRTSNQITMRQNMNDIRSALNNIKSNFEIQLNIEKLKFALNRFAIENPSVEINRKGKYLFVTYYEIPENLNEVLEDSILNSIARHSDSIDDLNNYVIGSKKLKTNYKSIVDDLKRLINGDFFNAKKEFYEIKNTSLDYKKTIKTMNDLNTHLELNNIINLTKGSPGMKSVAYLDMLFDLEEKILILDQPEDNIDNDYISNYLVPNIKSKKQIKQLIFVTHNPSVAVYGDAFNYIFVENSDDINYTNYLIERTEDKEKLIKILEGGRPSFSNRNKKFGNILGEEEYETN